MSSGGLAALVKRALVLARLNGVAGGACASGKLQARLSRLEGAIWRESCNDRPC